MCIYMQWGYLHASVTFLTVDVSVLRIEYRHDTTIDVYDRRILTVYHIGYITNLFSEYGNSSWSRVYHPAIEWRENMWESCCLSLPLTATYVTRPLCPVGDAIVLSNGKAALWTDARYFLQADDQMDCNWTLMKMGKISTWVDMYTILSKMKI